MTATIDSVGDVLSEQDQRIYRLEQQINNPDVVHQNEFSSVVIGPPGNQETISMEIGDPTNLEVDPGALFNDTYVDVTWDAPGDGTAAQYDVYLIKQVGGVWELAQTQRVGGTSVRFTGLQPGYTYGVRVYALNAIGVPSDPLPAAGYLTFVSVADSTNPSTPAALSVTAGLRSIIATWNDVADEDVANGTGTYEVQIDRTGQFDGAAGSEFRSERTTATIVGFSDLSPNQQYYLRIRAIDNSGNPGGWTSTQTATTAQADTVDISDDAITAPLIAAQQIVSTHVSTVGLDAATIKFGTMEGDRIKANSLSAQALRASTLDVALGISAGSIYVGDAIGASGNTGVYLDNSGIRLFKNGALTAHLDAATGNASFTGVVSGSTITGSTVTGGLIRTSDTGGRVVLRPYSVYGAIEFYTTRTDSDGSPARIRPTWISGSGSGFSGFGEGITIHPPYSNSMFSSPSHIDIWGYDSGDPGNPSKSFIEMWSPKYRFWGGGDGQPSTNTLEITRKRLETFTTDTHFEHVGTMTIYGDLDLRPGVGRLFIEDVNIFGNTGNIKAITDGFAIYGPGDLCGVKFLRSGTSDILELHANDMVRAPRVYNNTSSFTTWVVVGPEGNLYRSSSSIRYKPDWEWAQGLEDAVLPEPITWTDQGRRYIGFGAEHVAKSFPGGAPDHDEDGHPENVDIRAVVAVLSEKVKRLEREVLEAV